MLSSGEEALPIAIASAMCTLGGKKKKKKQGERFLNDAVYFQFYNKPLDR